jgi:hypothetical protein
MKRHFLIATCAAAALAGVGCSKRSRSQPAVADIVCSPTDLPPPIGARGPQTVKIRFDTEVTGQLDDGSTYRYWTSTIRFGSVCLVRVTIQ